MVDGPSPAVEDRRTRRRDAAARRILAAAREALLEQTNADSLSLREIARRADFTPGALYRYFDSREALLETLFLEALELLASYVEPPLATSKGLPRLREVGIGYLAFGSDHPQDLALIFQSVVHVASWDEYVRLARPFSGLATAVREDVGAGLLALPDGLDAHGVAYGYWALLHGMAELQRAHLRLVTGDFPAMQLAAIDHFLAPLVPRGRRRTRRPSSHDTTAEEPS